MEAYTIKNKNQLLYKNYTKDKIVETFQKIRHNSKYVSKLRSKLTIKSKKTFISDKILSLTRNRYNFIEDYFHKISTDIINQAVSNGVGTIIIGKNDGWKQEINLGKKNNQNFVQIPFENLIKKLKYKALAKGIKVIITEESYTNPSCYMRKCAHN